MPVRQRVHITTSACRRFSIFATLVIGMVVAYPMSAFTVLEIPVSDDAVLTGGAREVNILIRLGRGG